MVIASALAALALISALGPSLPDSLPEPDSTVVLVHWRSVADAEVESVETGRPMLLLFTADWCPPCVALKSAVLSDSSVALAIERNFVPAQVEDSLDENLQSSPEVDQLKLKYFVTRLPTLVVTRANGGPAISKVGLPLYTDFMQFLLGARARLEEAEKRYQRSRRKNR